MSVGAVVRIERAILSLLAPITGARASGTALVHATGADVPIAANTYGVPVVTSAAGAKQLDVQRMVKTTADATATAAGVSVPIVSVLGGARMNLPAATPIAWTPNVSGVELSSAVEAGGLAGGADPTGPPLAKRILVFEGLGQKDAADGLWRAKAGDFPAVVLSWEGAGAAQKQGRGRELRAHRFRLYVVVSRLDGDDARRDEGKVLLETLAEFLADRSAADGESFSNPPTTLGAAGKLALSATSYVYWLEVEVHHSTLKRELRTFAPWTASEEILQTMPTPEYPDPAASVTLVDQQHDMDPDT